MSLEVKKSEDKLLTTLQQEYKILAELKMIESEKIGGVYVIPSSKNSLLWYGVIFVRQGYYSDGAFRFTISLPENFPDDNLPPTIIFQSEIFHPLISSFTGTLEISNAFPCWKTGEDHIWQVLKYIQAIFIEPLECSRNGNKVNNQDALNLVEQNLEGFIERVKNCVTLSIDRVYDDAPTDDPHYISFEKFDDDVHGPILESIKQGKFFPSSPKADATGGGLSWVKEGEFKPLSVD